MRAGLGAQRSRVFWEAVPCLLGWAQSLVWLGWAFSEQRREMPAPFIRINHPALQHTPTTPLLLPLPVAATRWLLRSGGTAALRVLGFEQAPDPASGLTFWIRRRSGAASTSSKALLVLPGLGRCVTS